MDHVLVRYAEIGTKSEGVQLELQSRLRDRVDERLSAAGIDATVTTIRGRILIQTRAAQSAAEQVARLPGVASTSPAIKTDSSINAIKQATGSLTIHGTFGVDTNTAGDHGFSSQEVNETVGSYIESQTGAAVDLDAPDTWVEIDVRDVGAFVFTTRYEGPGGFPVGSQASMAALVSGGIDSPVAAYEVMTRGCDIVPIYFYNQPYAAGDHLARFEAVLDRLVEVHPGKDWFYYRVDMEPVNTALEAVDTGRMVLHRAVLFQVADHIATEEDLAGIVTGESIGQKSSQTATNLDRTSSAVDHPIHRPLITMPKAEITQRARNLGTYDLSTVDSACRSIAPPNPATALPATRYQELIESVDLETLIENAIASTTRVDYNRP